LALSATLAAERRLASRGTTALGMTTRQLAKAVGVTQAAVVDAERREAKGDITLTTLQRYAAALGCELTYALLRRLLAPLNTFGQQLPSEWSDT
jgi:transcriptional regulator with XRE-family HTH domain